jgi:hypothetical protein
MRPVVRNAGSLLLIWSILTGLALPYLVTAQPFDADAHYGPPVPAEHAVPQFESPRPAAAGGHCLICHWWTAISTSVVTPRAAIALVGVIRALPPVRIDQTPASAVVESRSPRGPPVSS